MANATKRGPDSWLGRYRDAAGKEHGKTFSTRREALAWAQGQERAIRLQEWSDPERSKVTVLDWSRQWLHAQLQLKPSTRARYEGLIRVHIVPQWGALTLAQVGHADMCAWTARLLRQGSAPATVRHAHRVFSQILAQAVRDGRIARNPATDVPLPRSVGAEKRFLNHRQVSALADACGPYATAVRVLAYCGLRFGELAALRVQRIDLLRRRLTITESATEVNGVVVFGTPKTHQRRTVGLPSLLLDDLARELAGRQPDDFAFPAPAGGVLRLRNFRRAVFDPASRATGLVGLSPHSLRHTAASLAVQAGANVKHVQRMLGHASAAMTLDVYSGLFEDDLDVLAERLSAAAADAVRTDNVVRLLPGRPAALRTAETSVGPVGLEPTTRGLKARCSAN